MEVDEPTLNPAVGEQIDVKTAEEDDIPEPQEAEDKPDEGGSKS